MGHKPMRITDEIHVKELVYAVDTVTRLCYDAAQRWHASQLGRAAAVLMSNEIGGKGAQTGDIHVRDTAGGDITYGAEAELLVSLLERQIDKEAQFRLLLITALERQHERVLSDLRILRLIIVTTAIALLVLLIIIGRG